MPKIVDKCPGCGMDLCVCTNHFRQETPDSRSDVHQLVNFGLPPNKAQDDFVYVFKKYDKYAVYGTIDAEMNKYKLHDKGFSHIATLSASIWITTLLNGGYKNAIDQIQDLS